MFCPFPLSPFAKPLLLLGLECVKGTPHGPKLLPCADPENRTTKTKYLFSIDYSQHKFLDFPVDFVLLRF